MPRVRLAAPPKRRTFASEGALMGCSRSWSMCDPDRNNGASSDDEAGGGSAILRNNCSPKFRGPQRQP